ncbi:MAG TPA: PIN domain-containing protein [Candidatus Thermoplasmatota archaeon]|nr:PIN domain-containing protein [Candidatus Thermoplasmatota archaeon]
MTDVADTNLVLACIDEGDALHARARAHLSRVGRLTVTVPVWVEVLLVAKPRSVSFVEIAGKCEGSFEVEDLATFYAAAQALDAKKVATVFDAVHLATALVRHGSLHTADAALQRTGFPTTAF